MIFRLKNFTGHDLNQAPNSMKPHITKCNTLSHCNAAPAIVNVTGPFGKTSENDNIGCISFQAGTGFSVMISLHEALYDGDIVVQDRTARVEPDGMQCFCFQN